MARVSCIIASIILLICGVLHVHGIFFSQDLHPENAGLLELLKSSSIQMDKTGIMWNLWIGFHAVYGVALIFMGTVILFLSIKHFAVLCRLHFVLSLTILTVCFFAWIGFEYLITAFVISMSVPLFLFIIAYTLIVLKRPYQIGGYSTETGNDAKRN